MTEDERRIKQEDCRICDNYRQPGRSIENREQIEIAKFYEHLPKPTLISIHEFLNEQIYFRDPHAELDEENKAE